MSVRKIKGSWWVDFRWKRVRYRKRSPLNTRGGALEHELFLRKQLAEHDSLNHLDPRNCPKMPTFEEYTQEWLATYVRIHNRASERKGKASALRRHLLPRLGPLPLASIQRSHIEQYKAAALEDGLGAKTINNHLTILGKCLRTAQEDGLLQTIPVIKWLKKKPDEFDFLVPEESYQLLEDRTEPMWTDLARLAVRTGMRRGELIALDWSAVDLANARLTVRVSWVEGVLEAPKSNRVRHLPLTEDVVAMLAPRSRREGLVFHRPDGGPLSTSVMRHGLLRLCGRAGLRPIGWHVLRHTFASQLAMEGVPLLTIKELMGHSSIQMTMRYAHLAPSALAQAVPALLRAEARARENFGQPAVNRVPVPGFPPLPCVGFPAQISAQPTEKRPVAGAFFPGANSGNRTEGKHVIPVHPNSPSAL